MLDMRRHRLFLTVLLWVQLSGCEGRQPIVERLEISGRKFDIPRSCLGPPERSVSPDRVRTDSMLIDFVLPDARCPGKMDPDPGRVIPTESGPVAMLLVTPFGAGVRPVDAQNSKFASLTLAKPNSQTRDQVEHGHAAADQYRRFTKLDGISNVQYEARHSSANPNSFLVCVLNYFDTVHMPRVRRCDHYFVSRGLSFKVSYGRNWARNWQGIEAKIIRQFARFSTDSQNQRPVSGNRPPNMNG